VRGPGPGRAVEGNAQRIYGGRRCSQRAAERGYQERQREKGPARPSKKTAANAPKPMPTEVVRPSVVTLEELLGPSTSGGRRATVGLKRHRVVVSRAER
jgi:hypothetical protein